MKRIAGLLIALGAALILVTARAEFAVVSNTSSLNLRSGAGYEHGVIATASRGEWVDIHQSFGDWDYVTVVRTGQTGYMVDSFLTRAAAGAGSGTGVVYNQKAGGFLNLRAYPSYSAQVLGIYYNGATCSILGYANGWYNVEIDGMIGFFRQEFLKVNQGTQATVYSGNGRSVNVRSGPALTYKALGSLPSGSSVTVLTKGNGFWQISAGSTLGYMSSVFLSDTAPVPPSPDPTPHTDGYVIVSNPAAGRKLNLRAQPSLTAKVLATYANGTRLEVIDGGQTWCRVYSASSGLSGYVMTRYVTVYGVPGIPTKTVSNNGSYVNLRRTPAQARGNVLSRVSSGQTVTVLIPGDEWTQVRYDGQVGYMMTCFLK